MKPHRRTVWRGAHAGRRARRRSRSCVRHSSSGVGFVAVRRRCSVARRGRCWSWSASLGRKFFNSPINGDFEMVQMATAIAVFSFLPYCQARRGNIVVDTFTSWLPARANAFIDAFWDLVYAGMMGLDRRVPDDRRDRALSAAARPPCCCSSSSGRRWRSAPCFPLLLTCVALATAGACGCGDGHERPHHRRARLRRHAGADRAAHAGRPVDAGGGQRSATSICRAGRRSSPT